MFIHYKAIELLESTMDRIIHKILVTVVDHIDILHNQVTIIVHKVVRMAMGSNRFIKVIISLWS